MLSQQASPQKVSAIWIIYELAWQHQTQWNSSWASFCWKPVIQNRASSLQPAPMRREWRKSTTKVVPGPSPELPCLCLKAPLAPDEHLMTCAINHKCWIWVSRKLRSCDKDNNHDWMVATAGAVARSCCRYQSGSVSLNYPWTELKQSGFDTSVYSPDAFPKPSVYFLANFAFILYALG